MCKVTHKTGLAMANFNHACSDQAMALFIRCLYLVSQRQWYLVKMSEETRPVPAALVWLCKPYNQNIDRQTPMQWRALQCKPDEPCSEKSLNTISSFSILLKLLFAIFYLEDHPPVLQCVGCHILQKVTKNIYQVFKLIAQLFFSFASVHFSFPSRFLKGGLFTFSLTAFPLWRTEELSNEQLQNSTAGLLRTFRNALTGI